MTTRVAAAFAVLTLLAQSVASAQTREVRDDSGHRVVVGVDACRAISLAPGATAMAFAAGGGDCLVGTIAFSKEPDEAANIPVVGDAETLDFEKLLALRPAVVIVAVDVVQRMRIDRLRALGIPVYEVHVRRLADMPAGVKRLGQLFGTSAAADRSALALERELVALRDRYQARKPLRVLYQIWDKPIYTIGGAHVISDALQLCGARNVFADLATAAPAVTREAVLARQPQLILASGPPDSTRDWLEEWRRFGSLAAVKSGHLVPYSDERMDRMGPSMIAATASLCALIDTAR